jgi:hypothetical protein
MWTCASLNPGSANAPFRSIVRVDGRAGGENAVAGNRDGFGPGPRLVERVHASVDEHRVGETPLRAERHGRGDERQRNGEAKDAAHAALSPSTGEGQREVDVAKRSTERRYRHQTLG